jgi:hypothetical protein
VERILSVEEERILFGGEFFSGGLHWCSICSRRPATCLAFIEFLCVCEIMVARVIWCHMRVCRYADVLVHRCLAASLGLMKLPEVLKDKDDMEDIVANMNDRHTNAARAGRSSAQLHTLVFFRGKELVAEARVIRVQANGVIVLVPKFGIEGPVYFQESADAEDNTQGGTSPAAGKQVCGLWLPYVKLPCSTCEGESTEDLLVSSTEAPQTLCHLDLIAGRVGHVGWCMAQSLLVVLRRCHAVWK